MRQTMRALLTCAHCGASFEQTKPYPTMYCSRDCLRAHRSLELRERWAGRNRPKSGNNKDAFVFSTPDGAYRREADPALGF